MPPPPLVAPDAATLERLRKVTASVPGVVYQLRAHPDGRVTFPMAAGKEVDLLGFPPDRLREDGSASLSLVHPEDSRGVMESIEASRQGLTRWQRRYRVNHPERGTIWVEGEAQPERLEDGSTLWHGYIRDVTAQVREEEARAREEALSRQHQRLESLGVMAGGVAHDFNNVLMSILGHAELGMEAMRGVETPAGDEVREGLAQIADSARHAAEVCRQMLTYAGEAPSEPEPVDLRTLATETVRLLRASVSPKVRMEWSPPETFPPVTGDPGQLRQVLLNLLLNAAEATGNAGGTVTLTLDRARMEEVQDDLGVAPAGRALPSGAAARIRVRDQGHGMSAETAARIFEPFFTTKFTGRGLGLAATLGVVRAHRGSIRVDSTQGEGSTFTVLLPLAAQGVGRPDAEAPATDATATFPAMYTGTDAARAPSAPNGAWQGSEDPAPQGRVLIVDDEPALRKLGERILGRMGFETQVAVDGVEALERFEEGSWDLVLLDLMMPRMDGAEALRRIREARADQPVLIVSGYGESHLLSRLMAVGPIDGGALPVHGGDAPAAEGVGVRFLQKPYTTTQLRSAVAAALQRDL